MFSCQFHPCRLSEANHQPLRSSTSSRYCPSVVLWYDAKCIVWVSLKENSIMHIDTAISLGWASCRPRLPAAYWNIPFTNLGTGFPVAFNLFSNLIPKICYRFLFACIGISCFCNIFSELQFIWIGLIYVQPCGFRYLHIFGLCCPWSTEKQLLTAWLRQ